MKLRRYISDKDYDVIKDWISDERTNVLWSAGRVDFPLNKELFEIFLQDINDRSMKRTVLSAFTVYPLMKKLRKRC